MKYLLNLFKRTFSNHIKKMILLNKKNKSYKHIFLNIKKIKKNTQNDIKTKKCINKSGEKYIYIQNKNNLVSTITQNVINKSGENTKYIQNEANSVSVKANDCINESGENNKKKNIKSESIADVYIKQNDNLKLMNLGNKKNLEYDTKIEISMNNIKYEEIRRYYLNNNNSFINSDGLKCNILSAIHCDEKNILFYSLVFSFTNINNNYIELIKIHIKNEKTNETVVKDVEFIIVNNKCTAQNERTFSNIKIAMKIQENNEISRYAKENTFIQDISLDNIFYIIEYRIWNSYTDCIANANFNALNNSH
ncbi:conserved Plasmodium protein, unknown function [Plasmodium sp. gorilla clade G2]|uniref:conserved Plasmodium protein, unknown function n=1 Tax=Plasmodium sp. gorilla clade G2 TaxID=880535 RepID=UPI000D2154DB|nr:conserved Plasmodium protein, unknown function [Plasmodium sp. gorilla clade G2]SOV14894.1 conserved Plasmodium protein, unknown function [Plasmodium sp. gorilla clade G2]